MDDVITETKMQRRHMANNRTTAATTSTTAATTTTDALITDSSASSSETITPLPTTQGHLEILAFLSTFSVLELLLRGQTELQREQHSQFMEVLAEHRQLMVDFWRPQNSSNNVTYLNCTVLEREKEKN